MTEKWCDIEGYEGIYQVSNRGRVKHLVGYQCKTERYLCGMADKDGYLNVKLRKNGIPSTHKIHRLVAKAYIDNPFNKRTVNHIDCNKRNNNVENLEWATDEEQMQHASQNGLLHFTSKQLTAIRTALSRPVEQYTTDNLFICRYDSMRQAAEKVGCSRSNINRACNKLQHTAAGYVWKYSEAK